MAAGAAAELDETLKAIRACRLCADGFSHAPRPIVQASGAARIAIFGQAPGNLAHQSGRPFTDPSGVRLRDWLQVSEAAFYDPNTFVIAPMAFCFPGYDANGGDLPPPKLCAETWRTRLLDAVGAVDLTLLVGGYAQKWTLAGRRKRTLTETVRAWREYAPAIIPLPHPSWRNNRWLKDNPWFDAELLPHLRREVRRRVS